MKKLLLLMLLAIATTSFSQNTGSISGKITGKQTNEVLIGATVTIKGTQTSVITNTQGYFIFKKVNAGKIILIVSYVGYESVELTTAVTGGNATIVDIVLVVDTKVGNEIVVSASKHPEK